MGHSQADKAQTHERIVAIASRRLRERGLEGIGVADVMEEAGLTVGGFYKHFDSREALVVEALAASFGTWQAQIGAQATGGKKLTIDQLIGNYLSNAHRDNPGKGCAISALAADLARSSPATRKQCTEQVQRNLDLVAGLLEIGDDVSKRARAIFAFSVMVGAVSLARAVCDKALSDEILATAATRLKAMATEG
jgi:TetR/AcrR family transcriptional regulator, transcriptional repressor for nem operon